MMIRQTITILLVYMCISTLSAQNRKFREWDATAFCEPTIYHPFTYIRADHFIRMGRS